MITIQNFKITKLQKWVSCNHFKALKVTVGFKLLSSLLKAIHSEKIKANTICHFWEIRCDYFWKFYKLNQILFVQQI